MKYALVTGSGVDAAERCPPSVILPRSRHFASAADFGSAGHEFRQALVNHGAENALAMLPDIANRWGLTSAQASRLRWLCTRFEWMPPKGAVTELALGLFEDGSVRRVQGGQGRYLVPDDCILPLTLDVAWSEPEPLQYDAKTGEYRCPEGSILWTVDYKTGEGTYTPPVAINGQLFAAALLGARFTGAERVVPAVVYMQPGQGDWETLDHWLGEEELADIDRQIRATLAKVNEQRVKLDQDEPLDYGVGEHCALCPAGWCCPTKTSALRAWLAPAQLVRSDRQQIQLAAQPAALSDEQAHRLASFYPQLEAFVKQARDALQTHVEATGATITMSDGRVWGPYQRRQPHVDPAKALPLLRELIGEPFALKAASMSNASIERAVVAAREETVFLPTVKEVFGKLRSAGALVSGHQDCWGIHKPKTKDADEEGV